MKKNHEVKFEDVNKNGKVLITLRFYSNADDLYIPVYVKPIKPTAAEMKRYGTFEADEDQTGKSEFCRINLTKWKLVGAPKEVLPIVKHLVGKVIWAYFNGAECSWKFFDPDGDVERSNRGLYHLKGRFTDSKLEKLEDVLSLYDDRGELYAPHCDDKGNYGDESVHAVYDLKV